MKRIIPTEAEINTLLDECETDIIANKRDRAKARILEFLETSAGHLLDIIDSQTWRACNGSSTFMFKDIIKKWLECRDSLKLPYSGTNNEFRQLSLLNLNFHEVVIKVREDLSGRENESFRYAYKRVAPFDLLHLLASILIDAKEPSKKGFPDKTASELLTICKTFFSENEKELDERLTGKYIGVKKLDLQKTPVKNFCKPFVYWWKMSSGDHENEIFSSDLQAFLINNFTINQKNLNSKTVETAFRKWKTTYPTMEEELKRNRNKTPVKIHN